MSAKRPVVTMPWDALSDQPARVLGHHRRALRKHAWPDYLKVGAIAATCLPGIALRMRALPRPTPSSQPIDRHHIGVGVSPLDHDVDTIARLLDQLQCEHILVRFEWRRMHRWPELLAALTTLNRPVLAVLVQDRQAVCDHRRWRAGLERFYALRHERIQAVQALQAVNRLKWGCTTIGEALPLAEMACQVHRRHAPDLPLIGSSVIDFEPLATLRSVVTSRAIHYDALAALLYVDRRGGPDQRQYGWFDTQRKIQTIAAIADASPHVASRRLWLTEVNWPLKGAGKWAPTSQTEAVDEVTAGNHLRDYYLQAVATGLVERVYAWQLIARGYGLIDPDGMRQRPAFTELATLLRG